MENNTKTKKSIKDLFSKEREKRVIFLIIVLFLINVADLVATLAYSKIMKGLEANQIANYLFDHAGDNAVIFYKLTLTFFALGSLYYARRFHIAEKAAWFLFGIFLCLTIYWAIFVLTYLGYPPEVLFPFL